MRIVTSNAQDNAISILQARQVNVLEAQTRLTSGKRVSTASDDPIDAARAERALALEARTTASQRSLEASRTALQSSEKALGDATDIVQRVRELVVQAGDASYGDVQRLSIAQELRSLRDDLLRVANRGDGGGGYLFGGQGKTTPPFIDAPGGVKYDSTPGAQLAAYVEPLPLTVDGSEAFKVDPQTGIAGIFTALDDAVKGLATPAADATVPVSTVVADALTGVDGLLDSLVTSRARVGAALGHADAVENRMADTKLQAQTERSSAEDLDMVEAISKFQNRQTSYSAALQAYTSVQRLTLFDYIK